MEKWLRLLGRWVFLFFFAEAKRRVVRKAKVQALKTYLKVLQGVRLSLAGVIALSLLLQFFVMGLLLVLGAGIYFLPWEFETKVMTIMIVGGVMFALPLTVGLILLSQKAWYKYSGAEQMFKEIYSSDLEDSSELSKVA